eukprot:SAG22_NODE_96_length_20771_cov_33.186018_19_plen_69_part_00
MCFCTALWRRGQYFLMAYTFTSVYRVFCILLKVARHFAKIAGDVILDKPKGPGASEDPRNRAAGKKVE